MFNSLERRVLLAALVVAVLVRLEYLREFLGSPFARNLLLDAQWYDQAAGFIREGVSLDPGRAYFRPPLYPMFLAGIYGVFGQSLLAVRLIQMLLGVATIVMCWRISKLTHGERVANVTAVLAATYGMFVYFESEILTATLGLTLTTAAALLLLEGDRRGSFAISFAGGAAIGFAAITHAIALVLAPVAVLWALLRRPRRLLAALAVLLGVLVPVGAITARNVAAGGEFVPIATQGGINFYIGNNARSDGKSAIAPGFAEASQVIHGDTQYRDTMEVAARTLAERRLGRTLSAGEVSSFWFGQGFEWIRDHPKDALRLFFRKLVFLGSAFEISNNRDLWDQARRFTPILKLFLVQALLLIPIGAYGILRTGWRRREPVLLLGFLAVYGLTIAAFFVCARFRVPAMAWLLPFAASGAVTIFDEVRSLREHPGRVARGAGVLVFLLVLTNPLFLTNSGVADVLSVNDAPFHRYNLAVLFEREGHLDRAIDEYKAAALVAKGDPRIHLNLGNVLARTGRGDEAREEYRKVLAVAPDYEIAIRSNLGILATQEENWAEAIRQFEACLDIDPSHSQALIGLASSYLSSGRFDDAIITYRRAIEAKTGDELTLRRSLAVAYLETGLWEEATQEARAALKLDENDVVSVLTLGKVFASIGREADASQMWERARRIAPGVPAVERAIREAQARIP